jgi:uncharacterized protein with HEPN domain
LAVFSRAGSPCHAKKLLSEKFKKANPSLPWSAMARMRDKLIHHYRGVDLREIWKAAEAEIPKLLQFLESHGPEKTA